MLAAPVALSLGACTTVKEAVHGPELAPVGYPAALAPMDTRIISRDEPQAASSNSLWRVGARTFFHDQRASKVGDILTVMINIDDSAKTTNETSVGRTSGITAGIPHVFGLETSLGKILPSAYDPTNAISTNTKTTQDGSGAVNRQEKISTSIAVNVAAVLPNGNLVIQGTQEVKINNEVRQLTVAGIVRPEDISSANTAAATSAACRRPRPASRWWRSSGRSRPD
jgi:flagellar L-ring protein precursor FlgH